MTLSTFADADPLADVEQLVKRIYAYVAYRLGDGSEAEDVVATTFERAVRYRHTFNAKRGEPIAWLVGIAKHCLDDAVSSRRETVALADAEGDDALTAEAFEEATLDKIELRSAITRLSERDQELLALRFGADMSAKAIARMVDMRTNAVEVALHRAVARLRAELDPPSGVSARAAANAFEGR